MSDMFGTPNRRQPGKNQHGQEPERSNPQGDILKNMRVFVLLEESRGRLNTSREGWNNVSLVKKAIDMLSGGITLEEADLIVNAVESLEYKDQEAIALLIIAVLNESRGVKPWHLEVAQEHFAGEEYTITRGDSHSRTKDMASRIVSEAYQTVITKKGSGARISLKEPSPSPYSPDIIADISHPDIHGSVTFFNSDRIHFSNRYNNVIIESKKALQEFAEAVEEAYAACETQRSVAVRVKMREKLIERVYATNPRGESVDDFIISIQPANKILQGREVMFHFNENGIANTCCYTILFEDIQEFRDFIRRADEAFEAHKNGQ